MTGRESRAGFVLAGGKSSRMGENKALLSYSGSTLIERIAGAVKAAAGSVTVVGEPAIFSRFGWPVVPDRLPECGPLAGMESALANTTADWNLIVACDMPALDARLLQMLCDAEQHLAEEPDCLVPRGGEGRLQPLCALYHRRCRSSCTAALARGERKVVDWVQTLRVHYMPVEEPARFQNVNTPREWSEFLKSQHLVLQ